MAAIFEGSGMAPSNAAVVLLPSRLAGDGLVTGDRGPCMKLYSIEFSQRLGIAHCQPRELVIDEAKRANSLETLARVLSLDGIAVVSAPSTVVLGWCDVATIKRGLERSIARQGVEDIESVPLVAELVRSIRDHGIEHVAKDVHARLVRKFKDARFIFGTTSLTAGQWRKFREFTGRAEGEENITNLYASSEVGPLAASISPPGHDFPRPGGTTNTSLYCFPLAFPCLDTGNEIRLLPVERADHGVLLATRQGHDGLVVNLDTGDRLKVLDQEHGLPLLDGQVLRAGFFVKQGYPVPAFLPRAPASRFMAGDYLAKDGFEIENPSRAFETLHETFPGITRPLVFTAPASARDPWTLLVFFLHHDPVPDPATLLSACAGSGDTRFISTYHASGMLDVHVTAIDPSLVKEERVLLGQKVRDGLLPKGVLKSWPAFVVIKE